MTTITAELARDITRASSQQSYYTARLMVDPKLELDCYRAYGYFRWVDDVVDIDCNTRGERPGPVHRIQHLLTCFCVALQAAPGDLRTPRKGSLYQAGVINV